MDTFTQPSDAREDWPIGTVSGRDQDDQGHETEEQCDEAFEATLLLLDQKAAELLITLAGL